MLVHQTLRGTFPGSLMTIYRFIPALSGKTGLSGSGLAMIYIGVETLSYS